MESESGEKEEKSLCVVEEVLRGVLSRIAEGML